MKALDSTMKSDTYNIDWVKGWNEWKQRRYRSTILLPYVMGSGKDI